MKRIAHFCSELYFEQVTHGRHFHVHNNGQIQELEPRALAAVQSGTLLTTYDMSRYNVPFCKEESPHLRHKVSIRTTSQKLHKTLDARYQDFGSQRQYFGHCLPLEKFQRRCAIGFGRSFHVYVRNPTSRASSVN